MRLPLLQRIQLTCPLGIKQSQCQKMDLLTLGHQANRAEASVILMDHPSSDREKKASMCLLNTWVQ